MPPRVYIPNRSFHDFSEAARYGELVYLTEGLVRPGTSVNQLYRLLDERMAGSEPEDMLLVCSLSILNAVASSLLTHKHGAVNYLIYRQRTGSYKKYRIRLGEDDGQDYNDPDPSRTDL